MKEQTQENTRIDLAGDPMANLPEDREFTELTFDFYVIRSMIKHGGGFVSHLGEAALHADDDNIRRIKATWPEYWAKYRAIAKKNP